MRRACILAALASLLLTAPARADVLVHYPDRSVACGEDIQLGVWYQEYSGGPRWARMSIRSARGYVLWRKSVRATTRWRYWHYTPRCGRTYTVRYVVAGGTLTAKVRVRS
ncbi:MAG TPA: hypothetical protein VF549_08360 [Solirubrobacteraceae bacterium]|jgi:opacity protein-like surface antigen